MSESISFLGIWPAQAGFQFRAVRCLFITRKNKHRPVDHYKTGLTWFDIHGVSEYGTKAETNRSETVFKAIHCTASHRTSSPAA
jgi:hypothetical protein